MKKRFLSWFVAYLCTAVTVQAAPTVNFSYDAPGRLSTQTTALGFKSSFGYDSFGRMSSLNFPSGLGSASFQYNGQDRATVVTDPRTLSTTYDIDGFGQVSKQTSPDTGDTQNNFDEAGNLTGFTRADGQSVSFSYDATNRLSAVNAIDFNASFTYDTNGAVGLLATLADSLGQTVWTYDTKGRVASKIQTIDGRSLTVGYAWQGEMLTRITYPSGRVVVFGQDHGRVTAIFVDDQPAITNISYLAVGPISGWTLGTGENYVRNFDSYGRIVGYTGPTGQRTLTLDDDNRITVIKEASGGVVGTYSYDSLGRLTTASDGGVVRDYSYDLNGNRTQLRVSGAQQIIEVDPGSNRVLSVDSPQTAVHSHQHDDNGNLLSNGRVDLRWNSLGYAAQATANGHVTTYGYNGFGQRVRKATDSGDVRYFVYAEDNQTLLGEYDATGRPVAEYVYVSGLPALVLKNSGVYYVLPDHIGTPRGVKDMQGTLVWRWDSDAFGNGLASDDLANNGVFESNLRFPGQVYDRETSLHYNNARYYDPATGRYLSSDPIGLDGGLNTYTYALGQPTGLVDPSGLWVPVALAVARIAVPVLANVARLNSYGIAIAEMGAGVSLAAVPLAPAAAIVGPRAIQSVRTLVCADSAMGRSLLQALGPARGRVIFKGMEVRAVRDLSHLTEGTLRKMSEVGFAARDVKGKQLQLHHHNQNPLGPIIEIPRPNHSIWNVRQHPFGNAKGVGLTAEERVEFNQWREAYWKWRADEELTKRGLN